MKWVTDNVSKPNFNLTFLTFKICYRFQKILWKWRRRNIQMELQIWLLSKLKGPPETTNRNRNRNRNRTRSVLSRSTMISLGSRTIRAAATSVFRVWLKGNASRLSGYSSSYAGLPPFRSEFIKKSNLASKR